MNEKITQALTKMFQTNRIVFWYDEKKELREDFEGVEIPGVQKIEIQNNEFGIKYRVLRQEPEGKFLLFHEGEMPEKKDNWLLDLYLSSEEFRTDQAALWLAELGLGIEFAALAKDHNGFFTVARRRELLKNKRSTDDGYKQIRMKMTAICCGAVVEPRLESIMESLLGEYAIGKSSRFADIKRSNLDGFFFEQLKRKYGYDVNEPSIADFAIELFKSCYALELNENAKLTHDALLFMNRWKDSISQKEIFEILSEKCADVLDIENDLYSRELKELRDIDFFEMIDKRIISALPQKVMDRTMPSEQIETIIRQRIKSHWFGIYRHFYDCLEYAVEFFERLSSIKINMDCAETGIKNYTQTWFRVDQLYRKTIYHYRKSNNPLLKPLIDQVEDYYSNNYLMELGDLWQHETEKQSGWFIPGIQQQRRFFNHNVQSFLNAKKKVVVIISDAMRFEVGEELWRRIQEENRYEAKLNFQQSPLPSYTQLGMAALLPHKELSFDDSGNGNVLADGVNTSGTANRSKILNNTVEGGAIAVKAEDFKAMGKQESRELTKNHDVVYVYHNIIDYTGDKRESEGKAFDAVEDTIEELLVIIKRLAGANVSNMIITADHGFIYQNNELDESDFVGKEEGDSNVLKYDRRFLLGKGLSKKEFAVSYTSEQLGLSGDMEVQIPRSINRMRLKGSGCRFVHGGNTLQEIVVPVISVNKKRKDNTSCVNVDILRGSTSIITSRQFSVVFLQEQAVEAKLQPRSLRASVYSTDGKLLSDVHDLCFNNESSEPQGREVPVRFVLSSEAEDFTGQEIVVKLEERAGTTSHYKEYKSSRYNLRLHAGFGMDF